MTVKPENMLSARDSKAFFAGHRVTSAYAIPVASVRGDEGRIFGAVVPTNIEISVTSSGGVMLSEVVYQSFATPEECVRAGWRIQMDEYQLSLCSWHVPDAKVKPEPTPDEIARQAVREMRKMLPQLNGFARALTGDENVKVVVSGGNQCTDGKTIYMRPLGEMGTKAWRAHDRQVCGERDPETGLKRCSACSLHEAVMVTLYHEISHIKFDTFAPVADADRFKILELGIAEAGDKGSYRAKQIMKKLKASDPRGYMDAAVLVSPFLPTLLNTLEDLRVNEEMFQSRPGTRVMFGANEHSILKDGIKLPDGTHKMWKDQPRNLQAMIGLYCLADGTDPTGFLDDEVIELMQQDDIKKLIAKLPQARSVKSCYRLAFPLLEALRGHGFCKSSSDEPDEKPKPPPPPPPPPDEDAEESADEADEEGEPCGAGDSEPDDDDESTPGDTPSMPEPDDDRGTPGVGDATGDDDDDDDDGAPTGDDDDDGAPTGDDDDDGAPTGDDDDDGAPTGDDDDDDDDGAPTGDDDDDDDDGAPTGDDDDDDDDGAPTGDDDDDDDDGAPTGDDDDDDDDDGAPTGDDDDDDASDTGLGAAPEVTQEEIDEMKDALDEFTGHDKLKASADRGDSSDSPVSDAEIDRAVEQDEHFECSSKAVWTVRFWTDPLRDRDHSGYLGWAAPSTIETPAESIMAPALQKLRLAFTANKAAKHTRDLRQGKVDVGVLGRRVPVEDGRIFKRTDRPGRKDYFVVIGLDISGSTNGERCELIKAAANAQAELLHRLGIPFAMYAHTASEFTDEVGRGRASRDSSSGRYIQVDLFVVKGEHQQWDASAKNRLAMLRGRGGNLDGHTIEQYRKVADAHRATDKIILYYTDGAMPCENYEEELEILLREIKTAKQKGIHLVAVGVNSEESLQYGLDTILLNSLEDVPVVVEGLRTRLQDHVARR